VNNWCIHYDVLVYEDFSWGMFCGNLFNQLIKLLIEFLYLSL